jgi:hypothetical protein
MSPACEKCRGYAAPAVVVYHGSSYEAHIYCIACGINQYLSFKSAVTNQKQIKRVASRDQIVADVKTLAIDSFGLAHRLNVIFDGLSDECLQLAATEIKKLKRSTLSPLIPESALADAIRFSYRIATQLLLQAGVWSFPLCLCDLYPYLPMPLIAIVGSFFAREPNNEQSFDELNPQLWSDAHDLVDLYVSCSCPILFNQPSNDPFLGFSSGRLCGHDPNVHLLCDNVQFHSIINRFRTL